MSLLFKIGNFENCVRFVLYCSIFCVITLKTSENNTLQDATSYEKAKMVKAFPEQKK